MKRMYFCFDKQEICIMRNSPFNVTSSRRVALDSFKKPITSKSKGSELDNSPQAGRLRTGTLKASKGGNNRNNTIVLYD